MACLFGDGFRCITLYGVGGSQQVLAKDAPKRWRVEETRRDIGNARRVIDEW